MNKKSHVLALIGLGFYQMLVNEEVSYDDVEKILNALLKPGEKIELSAEEIKSMAAFVSESLLKSEKM